MVEGLVQSPNAVVVIVVSDCMWNAKTRSQFVIVLLSARRADATVDFQTPLLLWHVGVLSFLVPQGILIL